MEHPPPPHLEWTLHTLTDCSSKKHFFFFYLSSVKHRRQHQDKSDLFVCSEYTLPSTQSKYRHTHTQRLSDSAQNHGRSGGQTMTCTNTTHAVQVSASSSACGQVDVNPHGLIWTGWNSLEARDGHIYLARWPSLLPGE